MRKIYVDADNKIVALDTTDRTDVTEYEIDETQSFVGFSDARIKCYKYIVSDSSVQITPFMVETDILLAEKDAEIDALVVEVLEKDYQLLTGEVLS